MKWIFIIMSVFSSFHSFTQNTFSRIYDLDDEALRNHLNDFEVIENSIYTYSTLFCDLEDSFDVTCVALTKYNMQGDIIEKIVLDTINAHPFCYEGLTYYNDTIVMTTYGKSEKFKKVTLIQFDSNFNHLSTNKYFEPNTTAELENTGVEHIEGSLYYYGNIHNHVDIPDSVHIIKIDLDGNELDRFYYSYGNSSLEINNFQATPDGNFAFILKIKSPAGANNSYDGFQLMKIDTAGNVMYTYAFEDSDKQPNSLLATSDGGYVFSSIDHPITGGDIFTTGYGLINKMNLNKDTLEWSLILPNDQLVDGRHYRMYDYIEANNGDIVACGMSYDNTDTELGTGVPDKNSTWNGFIVRLSPEGEIKWLKLYKNDNDLLPQDEYGRFRPSLLKDIKELPDGRFVAAGNVFVNNNQFFAIDELETEAFHLWLLMVDESGCLEGLDCEEIIRLGQNPNSTYAIGDEWIYEEETHFGGGNTEVGYKSFSIQDTLFDSVHTKYVLGIQDTFYIEDNKMYFWNDYYQEYVMYYDWQSTTSYEIKYYDQFMNSEEVATVVIDSISYKHFGNDSLKVQHIHIENSGTLEDYIDVVYEGVGAGYFEPKFLLGCGLCDDNPYTTKLRCFTNDTMIYQFVPYSCDSTWLITSTYESDVEIVIIYPNPTTDKVYIKGIEKDIEYELYTSKGQLLKKGMTENNMINLYSSGLFLIKLKVDNEWIFKKIVKIE